MLGGLSARHRLLRLTLGIKVLMNGINVAPLIILLFPEPRLAIIGLAK